MNVTINKKIDSEFYSMSDDQEYAERTAIDLMKCTAKTIQAPEFLDMVVPGLALKEQEESVIQSISLYTNVARSIIQVHGTTGTVKLFNAKGKLLLITLSKDQVAHFNINHLKKGIYFIEANHIFFEFVK